MKAKTRALTTLICSMAALCAAVVLMFYNFNPPLLLVLAALCVVVIMYAGARLLDLRRYPGGWFLLVLFLLTASCEGTIFTKGPYYKFESVELTLRDGTVLKYGASTGGIEPQTKIFFIKQDTSGVIYTVDMANVTEMYIAYQRDENGRVVRASSLAVREQR